MHRRETHRAAYYVATVFHQIVHDPPNSMLSLHLSKCKCNKIALLS